MLWRAGVVITFSLISGNQLHYLVSVLPPATIALGCLLKDASMRPLGQYASVSLGIILVAQFVALTFVFPSNDLSLGAKRIRLTGGDWAVAGRYQGELGFLARLEKPIRVLNGESVTSWLKAGPQRHLVDFNGQTSGLGRPAVVQPYRKDELRIFEPTLP